MQRLFSTLRLVFPCLITSLYLLSTFDVTRMIEFTRPPPDFILCEFKDQRRSRSGEFEDEALLYCRLQVVRVANT